VTAHKGDRKRIAQDAAVGGNPMQATPRRVVEAGQRRDGCFLSFMNVTCLTLGLIMSQNPQGEIPQVPRNRRDTKGP